MTCTLDQNRAIGPHRGQSFMVCLSSLPEKNGPMRNSRFFQGGAHISLKMMIVRTMI